MAGVKNILPPAGVQDPNRRYRVNVTFRTPSVEVSPPAFSHAAIMASLGIAHQRSRHRGASNTAVTAVNRAACARSACSIDLSARSQASSRCLPSPPAGGSPHQAGPPRGRIVPENLA